MRDLILQLSKSSIYSTKPLRSAEQRLLRRGRGKNRYLGYDMIGQAPGNGINGDYDGSYRSRNMLKYKKTVGDVDLYASYLFEDSEYLPGNGLRQA